MSKQLVVLVDKYVDEIIVLANLAAIFAAIIAVFYKQNLLVLVGAASMLIACAALRQNRRAIVERNTLEFIQGYNKSPRIDKAFAYIRSIKNMGENEIWSSFAGENKEDFLYLMNEFEILAIGWERNIYDKEMIEKSFERDIHRIYDKSKVLIQLIRDKEKDSQAFIEFERLASIANSTYLKKAAA